MAFRRFALALSTAALAAGPARADGPGPGQVSVDSFTTQGDGCPQGSTAIDVAPDGGAFTVLFSNYLAVAGGGHPGSQWKNCLLDLKLAVPPGWTFQLVGVDFRGYTDLEPGTLAEQMSTVNYPPGSNLTRLAILELDGPFADDYLHHLDVPPIYRVSAPCGGQTRRLTLHISTGVASRSGGNAMMTVDSVDGVLAHSYRMSWRACPHFGPR